MHICSLAAFSFLARAQTISGPGTANFICVCVSKLQGYCWMDDKEYDYRDGRISCWRVLGFWRLIVLYPLS
jgi:hypothetical protein